MIKKRDIAPFSPTEFQDLDILHCSHPFVWYKWKRYFTELIKIFTYRSEYFRNMIRPSHMKTFMSSHTGRIIIDQFGNISVVEATVKRGVIPKSLHKWIVDYQDVDILVSRVGYSELERNIAHGYIKRVWGSTDYDFLGFLDQLHYIIFKRWKGPKGRKASIKQYCSEFDANIDGDPKAYLKTPKDALERKNAIILGALEKRYIFLISSRGT